LIAAAGEIIRSTDGFREQFGGPPVSGWGLLAGDTERAGLEAVLSGRLESTVTAVTGKDGPEDLDVEAVVDSLGLRYALLSAPPSLPAVERRVAARAERGAS
jgi:hypothetical protein